MKKYVLTMLLGLFALAGFSQARFDVKLGMSMSNFTGDADADMKVGYKVGLGVDYAFTESWSLQSGLNFTGKGCKEGDLKMKLNYIELPVLAAFKMPINDNVKFVVNAGPYMAVGLGGKLTGIDDLDFKLFGKEDGLDEAAMNRFDFGIQYGIGVELYDHFLISATGQNGFINAYNNDFTSIGDWVKTDLSARNMTFYLSVGYRF